MNINDKAYIHLLKITIPPMVVFVILGLVIWQWKISALEDNQKKEVSEIISNVIEEQAKKDLLMPKIVFINADSSAKKELDKELTTQVAKILTTKYLLTIKHNLKILT
ncbi:MAG: hypothetical protein R2777_09125 [Chitinophagales bacterium]